MSRPYTAAEDAIILRHKPRVAFRKLKGSRTYQAVKAHRSGLKNGRPKHQKNPAEWTAADRLKLRRLWPDIPRTRDLVAVFGGRFDIWQIRSKAGGMKLKRRFNGAVQVEGHRELVDQIRIRAKRDGISIQQLDKQCGTSAYFRWQWTRQKKVNLTAIVRAVEFFEGKLVIDWCDR